VSHFARLHEGRDPAEVDDSRREGLLFPLVDDTWDGVLQSFLFDTAIRVRGFHQLDRFCVHLISLPRSFLTHARGLCEIVSSKSRSQFPYGLGMRLSEQSNYVNLTLLRRKVM